MENEKKDISKRWRYFLIQSAFIRNYKLFDRIKMRPNAIQKEKPFLDASLPGLLLIKAMAMFDEFLKEYIKNSNWNNKYRKDLNGRIDFLHDNGLIENVKELHDLRVLRNQLAHDSAVTITWENFEKSTHEINKSLKFMGCLKKDLPKYTAKAERSAFKEMANIEDNNILGSFTYTVTIYENEVRAAAHEWTENLLKE